jgi:hypothetical protein
MRIAVVFNPILVGLHLPDKPGNIVLHDVAESSSVLPLPSSLV